MNNVDNAIYHVLEIVHKNVSLPIYTLHTEGYHMQLFLVRYHIQRLNGSMLGASLVAQTVKRLPAMRETRVRFLGREDPLEKEMAIHSSTLAWKIPWPEESDRLESMGSQIVADTTERLHFHSLRHQ